ncbi:hypothetical protein FRB99_004759 [Tulasnella sp. 403]|nr:hypothetical protein FRB99_004759 [Tulasnella sp. 403]
MRFILTLTATLSFIAAAIAAPVVPAAVDSAANPVDPFYGRVAEPNPVDPFYGRVVELNPTNPFYGRVVVDTVGVPSETVTAQPISLQFSEQNPCLHPSDEELLNV